MKRICSSSTLIAGELAKRPSKESPTYLEDNNSNASSSAPSQPLLAITNGETCDEFSDMVWSSDAQQQQQQTSIRNNEVHDLVHTSLRNSPSPPNGLEVELAEDYSRAYFSLMQGARYGGEMGSDHHATSNSNSNSNRVVGNVGLVNQVPMFALWNK